jgi:hypothetical protein
VLAPRLLATRPMRRPCSDTELDGGPEVNFPPYRREMAAGPHKNECWTAAGERLGTTSGQLVDDRSPRMGRSRGARLLGKGTPGGWLTLPSRGENLQWEECDPTSIGQSSGASIPSVMDRGPSSGMS